MHRVLLTCVLVLLIALPLGACDRGGDGEGAGASGAGASAAPAGEAPTGEARDVFVITLDGEPIKASISLRVSGMVLGDGARLSVTGGWVNAAAASAAARADGEAAQQRAARQSFGTLEVKAVFSGQEPGRYAFTADPAAVTGDAPRVHVTLQAAEALGLPQPMVGEDGAFVVESFITEEQRGVPRVVGFIGAFEGTFVGQSDPSAEAAISGTVRKTPDGD